MTMPYKILIVDDEPENIQLLAVELIKHNKKFQILQALNTSVALQIAQTEKPSLIITDWLMPGGNGIDLVKNLKCNEETQNIPVIMTTGIMIGNEHLKEAFDVGVVDYIRKPFGPVELIARVESVFTLLKFHNDVVNLKNKELLGYAIAMAQNNKYNSKLLSKINDLEIFIASDEASAKKTIRELQNELSTKINEDSWAKLTSYFRQIHVDFEKKLIDQFPNLKPADIRLCTFIRLGMNTKDIASITYNAPESVRVARTRLRKKLKLNNNDNLISFLSKL